METRGVTAFLNAALCSTPMPALTYTRAPIPTRPSTKAPPLSRVALVAGTAGQLDVRRGLEGGLARERPARRPGVVGGRERAEPVVEDAAAGYAVAVGPG